MVSKPETGINLYTKLPFEYNLTSCSMWPNRGTVRYFIHNTSQNI